MTPTQAALILGVVSLLALGCTSERDTATASTSSVASVAATQLTIDDAIAVIKAENPDRYAGSTHSSLLHLDDEGFSDELPGTVFFYFVGDDPLAPETLSAIEDIGPEEIEIVMGMTHSEDKLRSVATAFVDGDYGRDGAISQIADVDPSRNGIFIVGPEDEEDLILTEARDKGFEPGVPIRVRQAQLG